jgi:hypothetical protein
VSGKIVDGEVEVGQQQEEEGGKCDDGQQFPAGRKSGKIQMIVFY